MSDAKHRSSLISDFENVARGLMMGAADIVPGVSGGTMALILGHYQRLINAISHIDSNFVKLLLTGKIRPAIEHADLRFLVALAIGVLGGAISLASLMSYLLDEHLSFTFAFFSGLILGSALLVLKSIKEWSIPTAIMLVIGAIVAFQICVLDPLDGELSPLNVFAAASLAICAMILPGISGAFVLLLLGMYHPITEMIKGLAKGGFTTERITTVAIFMAGCVVGLLAFSRVLKYLLVRHSNATLAFLVGLMIGSLYKIWPFQIPTPESADLKFKERIMVLQSPWESESSMIIVIALAIVGFVLVWVLEWIGKLVKTPQPEQSS